jgi:hypothetical protein
MKRFGRLCHDSIRDLLPIFIVIALFQVFVLERPIAEFLALSQGIVFVVLGLTLFVYGLELALFPIGEALAYALAERGSVAWLVAFAFLLGFGTTIAEPALIAVAGEASEAAAAAGAILTSVDAKSSYATGLRVVVAAAVGTALVIGVLRIVLGWSLIKMIMGGYAVAVAITFFAPPETIGIAYDSGGVTTSTVTVPLVAAFGVGLASALGGRNPMTDGFGLIAMASLTPMIFVMGYGMITAWL